MTPTEKGRFCQACSREVIDFSVLSDEEIKDFLISNAGKPACGHFNNSQLERIRVQLPGYFFQKKMPAWQKYMVVLLICFGSQMFSLDISVSNNGLYAQTASVKTVSKPKKQKKHKMKATRIEITSDFGTGTIDGFARSVLGSFRTESLPITVCAPIDFKETKDYSEDSAGLVSISTNPVPFDKDKREKDKKSSGPKLEFTVPAAFAYRMKKRRGGKK